MVENSACWLVFPDQGYFWQNSAGLWCLEGGVCHVYARVHKKVALLNLKLLKIGTSEKGGVKTNRKRRPEMIFFFNFFFSSMLWRAKRA